MEQIVNETVERALAKGSRATRLSEAEVFALSALSTPSDVHRLGAAALQNRTLRFGRRATYVINLQINPSNICKNACGFCRYSAREGDAHAYLLDEAAIFARIEATAPVEVHIVGGLNDHWNFERSLALVSEIRRRHPEMHIKAFTAPEIAHFAERGGLSQKEVLSRLIQAGMNAMPGGGAELFSERMRKKYCPEKLNPEGYLEIHQTAHRLGIGTNATMLYGLDETAAERAKHLLALRAAQDQSGGFACFIPLPYQPGEGAAPNRGPAPLTSLAVTAMARLVLDNFPHVKAYWPMLGLETAAVALSFGADDLDGTLGEERIAHAAGAKTPRSATRERMEDTIRQGGFEPTERDGMFNPCAAASGQAPRR